MRQKCHHDRILRRHLRELKGYENPIGQWTIVRPVKIEIDPEKLCLANMVEAKATWLYGLPSVRENDPH